MQDYELLLRPLAALLAGALVGLERSYRGRAAGLRTYARLFASARHCAESLWQKS